jgi:hypothetical protein
MSNSTRRPKSVKPSDNGELPEEQAAEQLREAVDNPGAEGIADEAPEVSDEPPAGIPEESMDPDPGVEGESLDDDPATMSVGLSKPGPYSFIQLFRGMKLRTVMLPYRERRDDSQGDSGEHRVDRRKTAGQAKKTEPPQIVHKRVGTARCQR